jgi:hypothetical protein
MLHSWSTPGVGLVVAHESVEIIPATIQERD